MKKMQSVTPPKSARPRIRIGATQQKILLLLLSGLALSCARSPGRQWRIIRGTIEGWKEISKREAERAIAALYASRLLSKKENQNGTITLMLSEDGKTRALTFEARRMKIPRPEFWDEKWRVFLFDIPETMREARDAFRDHLSFLGFHALQKSAAIFPFECRDEVDFLIELHGIREYVRYLVVDHIDNEKHLKKLFGLS